jgi:hypothetical protein
MIRVYRGRLTTWSSLDQMSTEPVAMGIFNAAAPRVRISAALRKFLPRAGFEFPSMKEPVGVC